MSRKEWSGAERPTDEEGRQYHIRCRRGEVARFCLLPGDPKRVPQIAAGWDEGHEAADSREHATWTGRVGGVDISACSTGVGGGSTANALEDLAEIGCDTLIRVGTCGAMQKRIAPGDLIVCTAAVRRDGTSDDYVINAYPAAAHYETVLALIEAAERVGCPYHVGPVCTAASFFPGQGRPGVGGYAQSSANAILRDMQAAGVLAFEMEAATVFTVSSLYGLRAGAVFTVVANRADDSFQYDGKTADSSIQVANLAVRLLDEWDKKKAARGKPFLYPSLIAAD
ncbi:MAG: nucleoside phosphorylase [Synergistaceae bacterium]|nr:nucleoside phosphorylase [Synergistaceae bacterium]